MPEPLLTKDTVNVAGHKIPIALLGVLVAVLGVFLVMRARSGGRSVSVGAQPAPDAQSVGVLGQGQEAQLSNLSQQLSAIGMQLNPPGPPAPPPPPPPPVTLIARPGYIPGPGGVGQVALWATPGADKLITTLPGGTQLVSAGAPVQGKPYAEIQVAGGRPSPYWQPISYGGSTVYAWAPDAPLNSQSFPLP